jgi:hypothetical protein
MERRFRIANPGATAADLKTAGVYDLGDEFQDVFAKYLMPMRSAAQSAIADPDVFPKYHGKDEQDVDDQHQVAVLLSRALFMSP